MVALVGPVLRAKGRGPVHYLFAATLISMGAWGVAIFGMRTSDTEATAIVFERLALVAVSAASVFFYHFSRLYTGREGWIPLPWAYVLSAVAASTAASGLVVSAMTTEWYGYAPVYGDLYWPYLVSVYVLPLIGMANLAGHYLSLPASAARRRTLYVLLGVMCALTGGVADSLPVLATFYPFGMLGNLLFGLFTAAAILRYNLLNVQPFIRKGLVYSVVSVVILTIYVALVFSFGLVFQRDPFALSWAGQLAAVLAAGVSLKPVLDRIQTVADRWFWRGRNDHLNALERFTEQAKDITDLKRLAKVLEESVSAAMSAAEVRLLLPSAAGAFSAVTDNEAHEPRTLTLGSASALVGLIRISSDVIETDDLPDAIRESMSAGEKTDLADFGAELIVPIKHAGALSGILVLAGKMSGQPYAKEDLSLIRAAVNQTTVALVNAKLYDDVVSQRSRLEHLLQRVIGAQEDERRRLSMELHDSPVQWLTSVVYHVEACIESLRKDRNERALAELADIKALLDTTLSELRHTTAALRPPDLDRDGLSRALTAHAAAFESDSGIWCRIESAHEFPRLSPDVELTVYRVVQEALSNVRKHSGATEVRVRFRVEGDRPVTTITDDGRGFDVDAALASGTGRMGLLSIQERARLVGANAYISSKPGGGTQITLRLPAMATASEAKERAKEKLAVTAP